MTEGNFVYILGSYGKGGYRTYVGWTTALQRRLDQHNNGTGAKSTRGRQWHLIYAEKFESKTDAMSREWYLKKDKAFRKSLNVINEASNERADPKT